MSKYFGNCRYHGDIRFLVDTGASRTVLSEGDIAELEINYSNLQKLPRGLLGFGGRVDTYVIDDADLLFESDEGVYREHLRPLFVAKHKIKDKQLRERMKQLPSVLGCDILDKFALIRDRRKEIVIAQLVCSVKSKNECEEEI